AGEAGGAVGDVAPADRRRERLATGVDPKDPLPTVDVRPLDRDVPVEAAGTAQRGVEDVRPVGRPDHDDAAGDVEAVHLDEQLVERLLALIRSARGAPGAALTTGGVQLVDED